MQVSMLNRVEAITIFFICLLGLSSCVSEALARNCTRIVLLLTIVRCFIEPQILLRLLEIKSLLISMAIFFGIMFFSAVYGGHFFTVLQENSFWYQYSALLLPACIINIRTEQHIKTVVYSMLISLSVTDMYIIYQNINGVFRPSALIMEGVITATSLIMILVPAVIALWASNKYSGYGQLLLFICMLLSLAGAVALNTRGGWLALFPVLAAVIIYCIKDIRYKIMVLAIGCLAAVTVLTVMPSVQQRASEIVHSSSQQSVTERGLMWESAFKMGMDHPILGVGKGNYTRLYQEEYISPLAKEPTQGHAHSNFFQMFAENGIVGLLAYCGMVGTFLVWGWKRRKNIFGVILCASTLAFTLYGVTDYTLVNYGGMRIYWLLMGLCLSGTLANTEYMSH